MGEDSGDRAISPADCSYRTAVQMVYSSIANRERAEESQAAQRRRRGFKTSAQPQETRTSLGLESTCRSAQRVEMLYTLSQNFPALPFTVHHFQLQSSAISST